MLRRPVEIATEALGALSVAGATSRFLPRPQQERVEKYIAGKLERKIHERQDELDQVLHREETLGGEEKQLEQFVRENPQFENLQSNAEVRKRYYSFDRWRTDRLLERIGALYGEEYRVPGSYFALIERKGPNNIKAGVNQLAHVFGIPAPKVKFIKQLEPIEGHDGRPYAEYVGTEKTIYFTDRNIDSPYYVAHEFFHHLMNVSPKVRKTEVEAEKFLEKLQ